MARRSQVAGSLTTSALAMAALLLLLLGGAEAARATATATSRAVGGGGRSLRQVNAVASAVATEGASVNSLSQAVGGPGAPASSVVAAQGAGPVYVDCRQAAPPGADLVKLCGPGGAQQYAGGQPVQQQQQQQQPPQASAGASASSGGGGGWFNAPACPRPASAYRVTRDQQGRPWGWESNQSCALRGSNGQPTA